LDWDELVTMQVACLEDDINKVRIPDLIMAQDSIRSGLRVFPVDRHFLLLSQVTPSDLFE